MRIAINLASGSLQDSRVEAFGEAEHVNRPVYAGLGGLNRIVLVMNRGSWASQIEYPVNFNVKGKGDVVAHEFETGMRSEGLNVGQCASVKVIYTQHFIARFQ